MFNFINYWSYIMKTILLYKRTAGIWGTDCRLPNKTERNAGIVTRHSFERQHETIDHDVSVPSREPLNETSPLYNPAPLRGTMRRLRVPKCRPSEMHFVTRRFFHCTRCPCFQLHPPVFRTLAFYFIISENDIDNNTGSFSNI